MDVTATSADIQAGSDHARLDITAPHLLWIVVRVVVGSLLAVAAILKTTALLDGGWSPAGPGWRHSWYLAAAAACWELILATYLFTGRRARAAWTAALATFAVFAVVAFWDRWAGRGSCGCFGYWELKPSHAAALDVSVLFLLLISGPPSANAVSPAPRRRFVTRATIVAVLLLSAAASAARFTSGAALSRGGAREIFEPEVWAGSRLPFLDRIDTQVALDRGRWLLIFFRDDCPACVGKLNHYVELASAARERDSGLPRVAIVRLKDKGGTGVLLPFTNAGGVVARLDAAPWRFRTPTYVLINDGRVDPVVGNEVP